MPGITFSALSERGLSPLNDDAYCAEQIGRYFVCAVADGVAGHPDGGLASRTAIDTFAKTIRETQGSAREILMTAVRKADAAVSALSEKTPKREPLATTLVACLIDDKGTCTAIDIPGNVFVIGAKSVRTAAEAGRSHNPPGLGDPKHASPLQPDLSEMVAHVLGAPYRLKDSDFTEFVLGTDYLLLGSDGLTSVLTAETIASLVRVSAGNLEVACEKLVQEATRADSESTITVVLVHG